METTQVVTPRRVVSAVIRDGSRLLLARRNGQRDFPDHWECSGGKVEDGESDEVALIRECKEELGVQVRVGQMIGLVEMRPAGVLVVEGTHQVAGIKNPLTVTFYEVSVVEGTPKPLESAELRLCTIEEMRTMQLMPANRLLLPELAYFMIKVLEAGLVMAAANALAVRRNATELAMGWRRCTLSEFVVKLSENANPPAFSEWLEKALADAGKGAP